MKKLFLKLFLIAGISMPCLAGWEPPVQTNFMGTSFTWTNSTFGMAQLNALSIRYDTGVSNNISVYRVDANQNAFLLETTGVSNSIRYVVITPDGNGTIDVPKFHGIRIDQTATNTAYCIFDLNKPE